MNYVIMLIGGLIGIFLHSLVKVRAINRRLPNENYKSVFSAYWQAEWVSVILSITVVFLAMFISSEYLGVSNDEKNPGNLTELLQYKIAKFLKTTFAVLGYCADAALQAFFGVTEKKLQNKAKEGGVDQE
jgi:ABC-type Fe3+ transport system permease subunit